MSALATTGRIDLGYLDRDRAALAFNVRGGLHFEKRRCSHVGTALARNRSHIERAATLTVKRGSGQFRHRSVVP